MFEALKRHLPTPEQLSRNRWLRWLGPRLFHPSLWHASRRGIALGAAIGVFFGFLIPLAQIPVSAAVAVALRANLPSAVASTLVTNPVTFPPVYYAAWKVGGWVLGQEREVNDVASAAPAEPAPAAQGHALAGLWHYLAGVGRPLVVGLVIFAIGFGLLVYALVSLGWWLRVRLKRRGRLRQRTLQQELP